MFGNSPRITPRTRLGETPKTSAAAFPDIQTIEATWCLLRAWSSREFHVAATLARVGILSYLPTNRVRRIYRKRKVEVERPVYPTYIFAAIRRPGDWSDARTASGVIEMREIHRDAQARLVSDLAALQRSLAVSEVGEMDSEIYRPGVRVRVIRGQYEGVEGEVVRRREQYVLQVGVILLGNVLVRDIDPLDVRIIEPASGTNAA